MKHIIDIDEDIYKRVIANDTIYVLDDIDLIMLENAIAEGKPLREEFKEIRESINFIAEKCLPNCIAEEYEVKGLKTAISIIDRRIKEL